MCYYMEQIAHWTKAPKNWEWNSTWYLYFTVLVSFFFFFFFFSSSFFFFFPPSRLRCQSRDRFGVTSMYFRRTKIKRMFSSTGKRPTTQIPVAAGKPGDQVQRAQGSTSAIEDWQGCYWTSKRKRSWYFFFSLIGVVYRDHTFKYSATDCLRNVCVSGVPPTGRFFFSILFIIILKKKKKKKKRKKKKVSEIFTVSCVSIGSIRRRRCITQNLAPQSITKPD